jgi:hypothetical protein
MSQTTLIPDTEEAWESGNLGRDAEHVRITEGDQNGIDDALGLQPISIRLEKSLIDDFKTIAKLHGLGYQPLMRQALRRFAACEMKRIVQDMVAVKEQNERNAKRDEEPPKPSPQRKAA